MTLNARFFKFLSLTMVQPKIAAGKHQNLSPAVMPPYLAKSERRSDEWQLLGSPWTEIRRWLSLSVSELEVILDSGWSGKTKIAFLIWLRLDFSLSSLQGTTKTLTRSSVNRRPSQKCAQINENFAQMGAKEELTRPFSLWLLSNGF